MASVSIPCIHVWNNASVQLKAYSAPPTIGQEGGLSAPFSFGL